MTEEQGNQSENENLLRSSQRELEMSAMSCEREPESLSIQLE